MNARVFVTVLAAGTFAATVSAHLLPPTVGLSGRVRPYTAAARSALGRPPDVHDGGSDAALSADTLTRLFGPVLAALPRRLRGLVVASSDEVILRKLRQAGSVDPQVSEYRTRQFVAGAGGAVLGAAAGIGLSGTAAGALVFAVLGFVAATGRRRARLDRAIEERRARLRVELYTVNQLLALHVRTGGGPMQAIGRFVGRAGSGAAAADLREALAAAASGVPLAEALSRAADLTPCEHAARTYALLANGAERGADLGEALLALSADIRDARREEVRQAATRRRAAMLLPIIAILAPTMLLFITAPLPSIVFGLR